MAARLDEPSITLKSLPPDSTGGKRTDLGLRLKCPQESKGLHPLAAPCVISAPDRRTSSCQMYFTSRNSPLRRQ
ncbi:hypothetical protein CUJ84_pRLN1000326 (plasmid) [Rhizobium leguminosarum]|uniref:Uncharacterized protein n=1 Tax=Rhizobium leguminosarum TaxID=384 RepID=A0A2K9ZC15_RHILE|nr:hypothetical protein CUJ84_pRLN1000326 [Rhizobium leguminosarum]